MIAFEFAFFRVCSPAERVMFAILIGELYKYD